MVPLCHRDDWEAQTLADVQNYRECRLSARNADI
jgi:hypothetical protein